MFTLVTQSEVKELKGLIMSASAITLSIFACTSIFAFLTVRRVMIYLGAIISAVILSIVGIFLFNGPFEALIGLVVGILYVIIDTQLMIFKFENGICEPYEDARHLFYDLVKILFEIMKLLAKSKEKKDK